jgi:hypothetical protein
MKRAVPIWAVFAYFDEQLSRAEAEYERAFPTGIRIIDPSEPVLPTPTRERIRERFRWLSYVVRHAVDRTEDAGVGAVLARNLDDQLLEQVCLLGEQLYWQEWVDTVPRVLTEFAVTPFLRDSPGPGSDQISADFGGWCRQQMRGMDP